jgi:uncharacterized protein DUF1841
MEESRLQNLTLLGWTLQIWRDHRRGAVLQGQQAIVAYCLHNHPEWWKDWDSADTSENDRAITTRLIHIHNDAAVRLQIERSQPEQIRTLYEAMIEKGFTEFEAIHTLAIAFTEESASATEKGAEFSIEGYVEKANTYVKEALSRPHLARSAKSKTY